MWWNKLYNRLRHNVMSCWSRHVLLQDATSKRWFRILWCLEYWMQTLVFKINCVTLARIGFQTITMSWLQPMYVSKCFSLWDLKANWQCQCQCHCQSIDQQFHKNLQTTDRLTDWYRFTCKVWLIDLNALNAVPDSMMQWWMTPSWHRQ